MINDWPEEKLGEIIREYGEERNWRGIASRIVSHRPIDTTAQLVKVCIPPGVRLRLQGRTALTARREAFLTQWLA